MQQKLTAEEVPYNKEERNERVQWQFQGHEVHPHLHPPEPPRRRGVGDSTSPALRRRTLPGCRQSQSPLRVG